MSDPTPESARPAAEAPSDGEPEPRTFASSRIDQLPVKMLNDRILVDLEAPRRSSC